jgi:hypothetical protein
LRKITVHDEIEISEQADHHRLHEDAGVGDQREDRHVVVHGAPRCPAVGAAARGPPAAPSITATRTVASTQRRAVVGVRESGALREPQRRPPRLDDFQVDVEQSSRRAGRRYRMSISLTHVLQTRLRGEVAVALAQRPQPFGAHPLHPAQVGRVVARCRRRRCPSYVHANSDRRRVGVRHRGGILAAGATGPDREHRQAPAGRRQRPAAPAASARTPERRAATAIASGGPQQSPGPAELVGVERLGQAHAHHEAAAQPAMWARVDEA